ncbi:MAG: hypothetical protein ACRCV0_02575 [Brevinema sp.]
MCLEHSISHNLVRMSSVSNEVIYMRRASHAQSDNEGASKCA